MKKFLFFFIFGFFIFSYSAPEISAHMIIPQDIMDAILSNPDITDDEIDQMFAERYGMTAEEYTEKKSIEQEKAYEKSLEGDPQYDKYVSQLNQAENTVNDTITVEPINTAENSKEASVTSKSSINPLIIFTIFQQKEEKHLFALRRQLLDHVGSFWEKSYNAIFAGLFHIWGGIDHILFFLTLLLVLRPWKKLLIIITTFTVAHSITLLLVGAKVISVNAQLIEVIIAASIVYSAIFAGIQLMKYSYTIEQTKNQSYFFHTLAIVFIFGLFHGMGFAEVFKDFQFTFGEYAPFLFIYNFGIELGQIALLTIFFPIIVFLHKRYWGKAILLISSGIITIAAIIWVFQRI